MSIALLERPSATGLPPNGGGGLGGGGNLPDDLKKWIYKRGYFLMSTQILSPFWVDMFYLSHLFNASENAENYRAWLKEVMYEIIRYQKEKLNINAVIATRWACSTDDLFSETLLNICFELFREYPVVFEGMKIYELFNAGEKNSYYLNPVNDDSHTTDVNAVAFLALDIHFGVIENLLKINEESNLKIDSIVSVIGRCNPERRKFAILPLFDARNGGHKNRFSFIMDKNSSFYSEIFCPERLDYRKFIPFESWKEKYG